MSSNCDSDGCPIDHDGSKLEDGVFTSGAPVAIRSDVFREIFSGSGRDVDGTHIEANPLGGSWVKPSALSGGIPVVERIEIEDLGEGYESDEPLSPHAAVELCRSETSATVHAMLKTTKQERDALFAARRKLADALSFLRSKGFKEEQIFEAQQKDGFGPKPLIRDEYGLPVRNDVAGMKSPNPYVDKLKNKLEIDSNGAESDVGHDAHQVVGGKPQPKIANTQSVFGKLPKTDSHPAVDVKDGSVEGKIMGNGTSQSWAHVLKKDAAAIINFKYHPLGTEKIVEPPLEVLKQGNEKFKHCVVGTFTKGSKSYKEVSEFAFQFWGKKGLQKVYQKDTHTFVFHFDGMVSRDDVLTRGTWYVGRRPMVVTCWGSKPGKDNITSMPLWIKLTNIPDSYWTEEGLSYLASAVGKPLGADNLTSKLELLPFARMQVLYTLGDTLPTEILASVLDPFTEEKSVVKVAVSYPFRPLFCTGCKSLGHTVGACPSVSRIWVPKTTKVSDVTNAKADAKTDVKEAVKGMQDEPVIERVPVHVDKPIAETKDSPSTEDWTEVKRKKAAKASSESEASPTPPRTFVNLRNVDEIDQQARLTRSQRKRLRRLKGSSPPQPSV